MSRATVSIVSHGHGPLLKQVLDDLSRQTVRESLIVVVTLNLAGETFEPTHYPALSSVVIRNAVPKGFGANHNAAFERCRTDWFFVVNPDVRMPDPSVLERLMDPQSAHCVQGFKTGLIAPRIVNSAGGREDSVRPNLSLWSLLSRVIGGRREPLSATQTFRGKPFFWVAGMFLMISSEAYREVGGFDERFFLYCEDYDLSARVYLAGRSIVVREDVEVIHDAQRDSHRSRRHLQWHGTSLLRVWLSAAFWRVVFTRLI